MAVKDARLVRWFGRMISKVFGNEKRDKEIAALKARQDALEDMIPQYAATLLAVVDPAATVASATEKVITEAQAFQVTHDQKVADAQALMAEARIAQVNADKRRDLIAAMTHKS